MNQRGVYRFKCCNEGRPIANRTINGSPISPHYFIILSKTDYNFKSKEYITAVPISSVDNKISEWFILELTLEDVEPTQTDTTFGFLTKKTYVLCDRPCRINKTDLINKNIVTVLKPSRYDEIVTLISKSIKYNQSINV